MTNNVTKFSFYGTRNQRKRSQIQKHLEGCVGAEQKSPVPEKFKQRITGPVCDWKIFYRQQDAFSFANSRSSDLHVFAFESDTFGTRSGKRMYLVSEYEVFWHYYRQMLMTKRNHYEVIPEGAVCKLYFDLEFPKEQNPERNGNQMVDFLIKYVNEWMIKVFRVKCDRDAIVDMDASTDQKFSRHLVYMIHNAAFQDNINAGNFVHYIMDKARNQLESENAIPSSSDLEQEEDVLMQSFSKDDLSLLMVKNKHFDDVMFCDLGVYTKNRNFRMYKSCKFGKNNPLLLADQNKYRPRFFEKQKDWKEEEKQLFLDTLIANIRYSQNLEVLDFTKTGPLSKKGYSTKRKESSASQETLDGHSKSPYPEVDDFILSQINSNGLQGYIRHWLYFTNGAIIVYEIGKNRWCANIGRCHKSNNIMLIADLRKQVYYQKCHDPECRAVDYKSEDYSLPANVLPSYFCDDDEFFDGEDEDLLNASIDIEEKLKTSCKKSVSEEDEMMEDNEDLLNCLENFEKETFTCKS